MLAIDDVLSGAIQRKEAPFLVAQVANAAGVIYRGAAGEAAPGRAAGDDTAFRLFSMTKAVGSAAAMILIERGVFTMDTPVAEILPEWDELRVLDGWNGDEPILRRPTTTATIRHLATHTAGLDYPMWNADVARYLKTVLPSRDPGRLSSLTDYVLASDPGTRWGYGIATDWLGRAVEVADGRRIEVFCQDEILGPLGMSDTCFEPDALADRLAPIWRRDGGAFVAGARPLPRHPEFYGMGHALYATAPDYIRFLRMILNRGTLDGARVLSQMSVDAFCADQMRGLTFERMVSAAPKVTADVDLFPGIPATHSFGFLRNEAEIPAKRSAGSLGWAGVCNTHYWIDPARDLAAVLMTQSQPFLEKPFLQAYDAFERAVYDAF